MRGRGFAACIASGAILTGGAAATGDVEPRFTISTTTATVNDEIALRVERVPSPAQREIRLYLVPRGVAPAVRSRLDPRLSFVGSVRGSRHARVSFTLPPVEPGTYALAYARGSGVGVQPSPLLRVSAPPTGVCPVTKPNGNAPPGTASRAWFHGNGALSVMYHPDGTVVTNASGGSKLIWAARQGTSPIARLTVRYQLLDPLSAPLTAQVVGGTLAGYDGPSWASRMSFQPGCWKITGRLADANLSLSYIAQVVLGDG